MFLPNVGASSSFHCSRQPNEDEGLLRNLGQALVGHNEDQDLFSLKKTLKDSSFYSSNFYILCLIEVKPTSGNNVL